MSNRLLVRSSWRFFTRHPWQLWLTLLSIALGTAVIIALRGTIPDDFYRQLRVEWGYRDVTPLVEKPLVKDGLQYTLLGIDPFAAPLQRGEGQILLPMMSGVC